MIQTILENEFSNLIHGHTVLLIIVLVIIVLGPIAKSLGENSKLITYLLPRKHKKIERQMKNIEYSRTFNNDNLTMMIEDVAIDDLFNYSTGLNLTGIMREKLIEIYPRLRSQFRPRLIKVFQQNLELENEMIVVKNMLPTNLAFFCYFSFLFIILSFASLVTYQDISSPRWISIVLGVLLLAISILIMYRVMVITLARKFRKALASIYEIEPSEKRNHFLNILSRNWPGVISNALASLTKMVREGRRLLDSKR